MWLWAGTLKSFGILYIEYLEIFQQGVVATTALQTVFTLSMAVTCMTYIF